MGDQGASTTVGSQATFPFILCYKRLCKLSVDAVILSRPLCYILTKHTVKLPLHLQLIEHAVKRSCCPSTHLILPDTAVFFFIKLTVRRSHLPSLPNTAALYTIKVHRPNTPQHRSKFVHLADTRKKNQTQPNKKCGHWSKKKRSDRPLALVKFRTNSSKPVNICWLLASVRTVLVFKHFYSVLSTETKNWQAHTN